MPKHCLSLKPARWSPRRVRASSMKEVPWHMPTQPSRGGPRGCVLLASRHRTTRGERLRVSRKLALKQFLRDGDIFADIVFPVLVDGSVARNGGTHPFEDFDLVIQLPLEVRICFADEIAISVPMSLQLLHPGFENIRFGARGGVLREGGSRLHQLVKHLALFVKYGPRI